MDELENLLRYANGIHLELRRQLIEAHRAENSKTQLLSLIDGNASMADAKVLARVRVLADSIS
jgi:hypothetical protein